MKQDSGRAFERREKSEAQPPSLDIDLSKYARHIENFDLSEAQQLELLRHIFIIVYGAIEMGFTVNICEQIFGESVITSLPPSRVVKSHRDSEEIGRQQ